MTAPGRELHPRDVLIDLLGGADFDHEILDPAAAAAIILQRLSDSGFRVVDWQGAGFLLPVGVLREDAAIIDEQPHHVVLTVRVPINWIRDNHALLMALSEIAMRPPADGR